MNQRLQHCHLGWTGERIRCEEKGRDRLVCVRVCTLSCLCCVFDIVSLFSVASQCMTWEAVHSTFPFLKFRREYLK